MEMEKVFGSNLKLFKSTSLAEIEWQDELDELRLLSVALLIDAQQDMVVASSLSKYSTADLRELSRVELQTSSHKYSDGNSVEADYKITTLTFRFPDEFYRSQTISFVQRLNTEKKTYNTLILAKSSPKLTSLLFQWLHGNYSVITSPLVFKSTFIIDTLNFIINGITDHAKLGDIELTYKVKTPHGLLSSIGVEVPNKDIIDFSKQEGDLLDSIMDYLQVQTSISFKNLSLIRMKCNFIMITHDGKLKFLRGVPQLGITDLIRFTIWDFVDRIYQTI